MNCWAPPRNFLSVLWIENNCQESFLRSVCVSFANPLTLARQRSPLCSDFYLVCYPSTKFELFNERKTNLFAHLTVNKWGMTTVILLALWQKIWLFAMYQWMYQGNKGEIKLNTLWRIFWWCRCRGAAIKILKDRMINNSQTTHRIVL